MHIVDYAGALPVAGPPLAARAGHAVVGRVTIGQEAWLGAGSVIRGDGHYVRIGRGLHLGRGATIHIAHDLYPAVIGDRVCIGANAVVHACTLGDEVVVEEDAIVLDGAVVGPCTTIGAGSVVYPRTVLRACTLYQGHPAEPEHPLDRRELLDRAERLRRRNESADAGRECAPRPSRAQARAWVADTCRLVGDVSLCEGASVWFGCRIDASAGPVDVAALSNVQDNCVLTAGPAGLSIGEKTTIGHNVVLSECTVGARCLVGIGSRISAGSVVADDAFVAAGATTEVGQRLEGGFVWAGRPARPIGRMDDTRRAAILRIAEVYHGYASRMRRRSDAR